MANPNEFEKAKQREFESLDDFIRGQNNFYFYFLDDCFTGKQYRKEPVFKRFQELYGETEKRVTEKVVKARRSRPKEELPYEDLFKAYNLMRELVSINDPNVFKKGRIDEWYLCR